MMYPITLDLSRIRIALIGNGAAAVRRLAQLEEGGATRITLYADAPSPALAKAAGSRLRTRLPDAEDLRQANIVMIAGLDDERAGEIAIQARTLGILTNVEDRREHCDFHFASLIRRGDLLLTVSTNGKSPALGQHIRQELESLFGEEWAARLEEIATMREQWRRDGAAMQEVAERSRQYMADQGWFPSMQNMPATTESKPARDCAPRTVARKPARRLSANKNHHVSRNDGGELA